MRVFSLVEGRVVNVERVPTYGITVTVKELDSHRTTEHLYLFMDWSAVEVGDEVTPGQLIGTIPDGKMGDE